MNPFKRTAGGSSDDPDQLTAQGMEHLQQGDVEAAVAAFTAAVTFDPQHGQAWYGKGCAHSELSQFEDAVDAYQQSIQFAGDRVALPLFNLGNVYQELEQYQEAAQCFHQAVQADPTMSDAWINLGRILDDAGQHESAIECYDHSIAVEPDDPMAWSNRGNSLRSLQRFEESLDSYRKALELDDSDLAASIGIGVCLVQCDRAEEGLAALQEAVEASQHPLAMFEFGTALAMTGQHDAALVMFDTLVEHDFVSSELWNNRGESLAGLEQIESALESFDNAIALDAEFAPAWFGKARVLFNADRTDEARVAARQYRELADESELSSAGAQALLALCGVDSSE